MKTKTVGEATPFQQHYEVLDGKDYSKRDTKLRLRFVHHKVFPEIGMVCVKRYMLVWQVEVLASCLVESLIIVATKPNHQGQQSCYVWEALSTNNTMKHCY